MNKATQILVRLVVILLLAPAAMAQDTNHPLFGEDQPLSKEHREAQDAAAAWLNQPQQPTPNGARLQFVFGAGRPSLICAPLQVCTIELEPGEVITVGGLHLGDTARWQITPALGAGQQTHLVVKPLVAGLDTTLAIITNRRTYHLQLISTVDRFMPAIAWHYPQNQNKAWQAYRARQITKSEQKTLPATRQNLGNLNFDYDISACRSCLWRPLRVYDNSNRVYIQIPQQALILGEMPVLLVETDGVTGLVNYRVKNDRYIVDGLFARAWLIAGVGRNARKIKITRR